jgi:perosamine synthetase
MNRDSSPRSAPAPFRRHQLPVWSPLPGRAILAAVHGWHGGGIDPEAWVARALEKQFRPHALLLTDSGTTALTLAIRLALAGRIERPVAVPAYCCYDLATAVVGAGAQALVYDLDPATLGPDLESLERSLRAGAAAVVVAHLYGYPADLSAVGALAERHGAIVIEDAAQGSGGQLSGRPLGAVGALGVLSFGRGKGLTGGGGGALLANSEEWAPGLDAMAEVLPRRPSESGAFLALMAQWLFGRPGRYGMLASLPFLELGETVYRPPVAARRISPMSARVLATTLPLVEREANTRRSNAGRYQSILAGAIGLEPTLPGDQGVPGYLRFPLLASPEVRVAATLPEARRLGIMPGYPAPLADLSVFPRAPMPPGPALPGADLLAQRLITFPTHGLLSERDWAGLAAWVRAISTKAAG